MTNSQVRLRSLPARHARTRPCYQEPDTESDTNDKKALQKARPTRSSQRIRTYLDPGSSDEDDNQEASSERSNTKEQDANAINTTASSNRPNTTNKPRKPRKQKRRRRIVTRSQHNNQNNVINFKRRKLGHPRPANVKVDSSIIRFPRGGRKPPWQTLEYHILVKILKYAAYPLYSSALRSNSSLPWLSRTSRLCKSFYDAGMSALMYSPPLYPAAIAHSMISLLDSRTDPFGSSYPPRVRFLDIEVKELLMRKSGINLEYLLQNTPLLTGLRIFHEADEMIGKAAWADPVWKRGMWSYGDLFDILDAQNIHLKFFEWNGRFHDTYSIIPIAHSMPCLQRIESLTIVNVVFPLKQEVQRQNVRDIIVSAFGQAKNLSSLTFRNCNIVDAEMMPKLPPNLTSLTIMNCLSLTSDALESYLQHFGTHLKELHLIGNQVMDLGFMANLKALCPNLEQLHIDLSYLDASSYDDRDPLYDELLPNGSPTWPVTLSSVVIGPLRSLSVEDAENFYTSLISSAANLKYLRTLRIKTLLKAGSWRDRAQLRQKWGPIFDKVFYFEKRNVSSLNKMSGKSAPKQDLEDTTISESADDSDDNMSAEFPEPLSRQNACNIVEFELSDQRPAKDQFTMDDFRDTE